MKQKLSAPSGTVAGKAAAILVATMCIFGSNQSAEAAAKITIFDPPGSGVTGVLGINDAGQIVGWYARKIGHPEHGFLRNSDGTFVTFEVPGARDTLPASINDSGMIAGQYFRKSDGAVLGFMRSQDGLTITTVDPPGSIYTSVSSINASGEIVGSFEDSNSQWHGFVLTPDGAYTTLDVPSSEGTFAYSVNDDGAIAGTTYYGSGDHGFVYSGGVFTTFDPTGSLGTEATSIDANGSVTGVYHTTLGSGYRPGYFVNAFLYTSDGTIVTFQPCRERASESPESISNGQITGYCSHNAGYVRSVDGTITKIRPRNAVITFSAAINNNGVIAGFYRTSRSGNKTHGFLRTP